MTDKITADQTDEEWRTIEVVRDEADKDVLIECPTLVLRGEGVRTGRQDMGLPGSPVGDGAPGRVRIAPPLRPPPPRRASGGGPPGAAAIPGLVPVNAALGRISRRSPAKQVALSFHQP